MESIGWDWFLISAGRSAENCQLILGMECWVILFGSCSPVGLDVTAIGVANAPKHSSSVELRPINPKIYT